MVRVTRCVLRFVLLWTVLTAFATAQSPAPTPAESERHTAAEPFDIKAAIDISREDAARATGSSKAAIGCSCGIFSRRSL